MLGTKIKLVTRNEVRTNNSKFNLNQRTGFGEKTCGRIKATYELRFQLCNTVVGNVTKLCNTVVGIITKHLSI